MNRSALWCCIELASPAAVLTTSTHACFGGRQGYYTHQSTLMGASMRFSVFQPPKADQQRVPLLFYLAGLTCTEETFMIKAGAQRCAAELGIMLVSCDTSPRNTGIAGATVDWDFGEGASFYLDATQSPWREKFRMESYIVDELLDMVLANFPVDHKRIGIFGHSMGGHGALTLALRHPHIFKSVSALAPICAPSRCAWGQKAFAAYLGNDPEAWQAHDACELLRAGGGKFLGGILVDQGLDDKFLLQSQLHPEALVEACAAVGQPLTLRRHAGYDHGYYFVSTFVEEHLRFHHQQLD